ncbi:YqaA family protein [Neisseria sp. Ec49-e6-T10]|uniref:YqaA family protein n=1 Tax=Neisseria sp. Ec49-e6-T10 TaxID=3140744 RepID=UPI003EBF11CC
MWTAFFALVGAGYLSATLLPGTSELAFTTFLVAYPDAWLIALIGVSIANTLGSLTTYLMTFFIPNKKVDSVAVQKLHKYGTPALFFAFLPAVGDALPLAAGWLKMPILPCLFFMALGKIARYIIILLGVWVIKTG